MRLHKHSIQFSLIPALVFDLILPERLARVLASYVCMLALKIWSFGVFTIARCVVVLALCALGAFTIHGKMGRSPGNGLVALA